MGGCYQRLVLDQARDAGSWVDESADEAPTYQES